MSRAPLTSAQLDRIEDALEDLDLGVVESFRDAPDPDSAVLADHLQAYHQILELSRDVMPLQDAPLGVLDSVMAEAHAVAAANVAAGASAVAVTPAVEAAEPTPSLWQRMRASIWVPALGFAGAAALLLVVVRPAADSSAEPDVVARAEAPAAAAAATAKTESADERLADAAANAEPAGGVLSQYGDGLARGGGAVPVPPAEPEAEPETEEEADQYAGEVAAALGEKTKEVDDRRSRVRQKGDDAPVDVDIVEQKPSKPEPAPPPPPPVVQEPTRDAPKPGPSKAPSKKAPPRKSAGSKSNTAKDLPGVGGSLGKSDPAPGSGGAGGGATEDGEAQEAVLAKLVSRGESRRRSGNCGMAQLDFKKASTAGDAKTRAKAWAGMGLCELEAGNDSAAQSHFSRARAADPSIKAFIDRERSKLRGAMDPAPQSKK